MIKYFKQKVLSNLRYHLDRKNLVFINFDYRNFEIQIMIIWVLDFFHHLMKRFQHMLFLTLNVKLRLLYLQGLINLILI
jgi:hypothetical protein